MRIMKQRQDQTVRVKLAIRLADGVVVPVEASSDALKFIGFYSQLSVFGRPGRPLDAQVVGWH
jgi:hypothetical protein